MSGQIGAIHLTDLPDYHEYEGGEEYKAATKSKPKANQRDVVCFLHTPAQRAIKQEPEIEIEKKNQKRAHRRPLGEKRHGPSSSRPCRR